MVVVLAISITSQIRFFAFSIHNNQVTDFARFIILKIEGITFRIDSCNCFINLNGPLIYAIPDMRNTVI